ncbi:L-rhamnose isomerase, partial [Listeria monocytogenes]
MSSPKNTRSLLQLLQNYYCEIVGVPVGLDWLKEVKAY